MGFSVRKEGWFATAVTNLDSRVKGMSWDEKILLRFSASFMTSCTLGFDTSYFPHKSETSSSQDETLLIVQFESLNFRSSRKIAINVFQATIWLDLLLSRVFLCFIDCMLIKFRAFCNPASPNQSVFGILRNLFVDFRNVSFKSRYSLDLSLQRLRAKYSRRLFLQHHGSQFVRG